MKAPATVTRPRLSADEAFIALIISAMEANDHTAPEEAQRAQHIVGTMKRFRNMNGAALGRLIGSMKQLVHDQPPETVIHAACKSIPRSLRGSALAVVADIIVADGRLQRRERTFLMSIARLLGQPAPVASAILKIVRLKNSA